MSDHGRDRSGNCRADGSPWLTCPESQAEVLRSFDRELPSLAMWLATTLRDVEQQLGQVPRGMAARCYAVLEAGAFIESQRRAREQHLSVTAKARANGGRWNPP